MPRHKTIAGDALLQRAMEQFWHAGYLGTSVDDLVRATGSTRHTLYAEFGGKLGLLEACLDLYQATVVTPAFAAVEADDAAIAGIRAYFDTQIRRAARAGLPGPGCLIANLSTEIAPRTPRILARVRAHHQRLHDGFLGALRNAAGGAGDERRLRERADFLATSAQGLWSHSRTVASAAELRRYARTLVDLIEETLPHVRH